MTINELKDELHTNILPRFNKTANDFNRGMNCYK